MRITRLCGGFDAGLAGGLDPNIYYLSREQAKQGHEVEVLAFTKGKESEKEIAGFNVRWLKKPAMFRVFGGAKFFSEIKGLGLKPDVVHGLQAVPFGWLFGMAKKGTGAACALSIHNAVKPLAHYRRSGIIGTLNSLEFGLLSSRLARQSDLVLPIADFIKAELVEKGVEEKKISVIRTGVDFALFSRAKKKGKSDGPAQGKNRQQGGNATQCRRQTLAGGRRGKESDFNVLYAGRLADKKGAEYLIEAMALLGEGCRLRLVGATPRDEKWLQAKQAVKKNRLEERVEFIGSVPYMELPKQQAWADAFVLPSLFEPMGKVALEAMAAGTPVVATRQGGTKEFVFHGKNGLLVEPGNAGQIAGALEKLRESPELRKKLAAKGKETAEKFDWKKIASQYSKAFGGIA